MAVCWTTWTQNVWSMGLGHLGLAACSSCCKPSSPLVWLRAKSGRSEWHTPERSIRVSELRSLTPAEFMFPDEVLKINSLQRVNDVFRPWKFVYQIHRQLSWVVLDGSERTLGIMCALCVIDGKWVNQQTARHIFHRCLENSTIETGVTRRFYTDEFSCFFLTAMCMFSFSEIL